MFQNLRTGTKLVILCGLFIISVGVTIWGLVAEKRIAIDFARKELVGTRYLATLRTVYAAILTGRPDEKSAGGVLDALAAADAASAGKLQTAEFQRELSETLRNLWSAGADEGARDALFLDALAQAPRLALRVGDDSKLTLDPDLDTYYLQETVVSKLPPFLSRIGEMHALLRAPAAAETPASERSVRLLVLDGLLRSMTDGMKRNLASAYRGNADGRLKPAVDADFAAMIASADAYLDAARESVGDGGSNRSEAAASLDRLHAGVVESSIKAWSVVQAELERLLRLRIDGLVGKLVYSLLLIGALVGLSILVAVMTHRYIVQPLQRLEGVARTVSQTKDYSARIDHSSRDEIGRVTTGFNEMLAELDEARTREAADRARTAAMQAELARVSRLTTVGEMAASIAHEINQPLAAIVTNGNAGLRWLGNAAPDLDETRAALKRIVQDGHRASEVIGSVRAMFKKDDQKKERIDINELVREVLALVQGGLQDQRVAVRVELSEGLPPVSASRVQLQQVMLNLIMNAAEAMASVTDRPRELRVRSERHDEGAIRVTVEDSGKGIDPDDVGRIFDAFFTTKANGMGMGLSICRSIVEAHNGRLSASPRHPHGSVFQIVLPGEGGGAG